MFRRHRTSRHTRAGAAVAALTLAGALSLGEVVAAGHHDCHDRDDGSCAVCLFIKAPTCLPEGQLHVLSVPTFMQRLILPPRSQPNHRPLLGITTRSPPL